MPAVEITLLGGFAAIVDGEPVAPNAWRLRKARELVKLLALAPGHRLHREQAMDAFWRDRAPAAAANNLHQSVHAARRALGPEAIEVRDELLRLCADVDVDRFERAVADARRARAAGAYRAALSLYGGELLPENRYDDWVTDRRDELAVLREDVANELAGLGAADGLRGLPTDASSFVGREHELTELRSLLRGTRLLTLSGTGGAGKTRLALELARETEQAFASGAALVELAPVSDDGHVVDAVAAALDVHALPDGELIDAVAEFLAPRSLLLVVDNCEHVLGASAALVDALLRGAPRLTVVATSREPLRVPGEVVFRVPSLTIPDPEQQLSPRELLRYEAVRLFAERGAAAAPGFEVDAANALDVARICFRLDGLPLALELSAARLGALGPRSIAERLDDRFRLLRSGSPAAPTRQQTLAATLQWSHDLLDADERMLLRRLAVFAGGFTLDAVEAVSSGDGLDVGETADVLARLVEKSLVSADDGARERRYGLLETVRLYAAERLTEAGEWSWLAVRHAEWALALAERDPDQLDGESANMRVALDDLMARDATEALRLCVALWPAWLRRIDLAEGRRRFDEALAAAPEPSARRAEALFAAAAIDFRAGTVDHAVERAEESLAVAVEVADRRAEWRALQLLGCSAVAHDDADDAASWFGRGLELAQRERFAAGEALGIYSLGVARCMVGDLADAEALWAQSVARFRTVEGSDEQILAPTNVAEMLSTESGGGLGVRIVFEETLQPFVEIGCGSAIGYVLANQAGVVRARGEHEQARMLLDEADAAFARVADERGHADVLVRRAYLELARGEIDATRSHLEDALEQRRRLNDRRGVGLVLQGLGLIATIAEEYPAADEYLAEARDLFSRAGDRWGLATTLWRAADLAVARNDVATAEAALQEALDVLDAARRERWIALTLTGLAEVAALRGDDARADELLADAQARFEAKRDPVGVAAVAAGRRRLAQSTQRPRKGRAATTTPTHRTKGRRR